MTNGNDLVEYIEIHGERLVDKFMEKHKDEFNEFVLREFSERRR